MKFKELKDMSKVELAKKANEVKKSLFEMRMKNTLGQMSNPLEIRSTRRSMAKVLTALNQKSTNE